MSESVLFNDPSITRLFRVITYVWVLCVAIAMCRYKSPRTHRGESPTLFEKWSGVFSLPWHRHSGTGGLGFESHPKDAFDSWSKVPFLVCLWYDTFHHPLMDSESTIFIMSLV